MATVGELLPGTALPVTTPLPGAPSSQAGAAEATKNENWRFVEPQPIREDQVENAVKFLSHPKVKGSPIVYRRSFLEKKGLSREEIDEAFRRVPDPPSDSSTATVPTTGTQAGVPGVVAPPQQMTLMQPGPGQMTAAAQPKPSSWAQMILALGVLTAGGAGAGILTKRFLIPKLKHWIRHVVLGESEQVEPGKLPKRSPLEEATAQAVAAATAATTAAAQMIGAMQAIEHSRSEDRQRLDNIIRAVEVQTVELKNALAGMKDVSENSEVTKYQRPVANNQQAPGHGNLDYWKGQANGVRTPSTSESRDYNSFKVPYVGAASDQSPGFSHNDQQVRSMSAPPTSAPHSQSYMDIIAMLERGEKPPGIREVNDKPPNPAQVPSNPRLQPKAKPWEKAGVEARPFSPLVGNSADQPGRYVESYNAASSSNVNLAMRTESLTGSGAGAPSENWWQKRAEPEISSYPTSVKITEVDLDTEADLGTPQTRSSTSPNSNGGRPGWIPPAVPQPIYPGAEEAIRRPKPAAGASFPNPPAALENGFVAAASSSPQTDAAPSISATFSEQQPTASPSGAQAVEPVEQQLEAQERAASDPSNSFRNEAMEE